MVVKPPCAGHCLVVCDDELSEGVDVGYLKTVGVGQPVVKAVECVFESADLSVVCEVEEVVVALGAEGVVQGGKRLHEDTHEGGEDRFAQESRGEQDGEFLIVDFKGCHRGGSQWLRLLLQTHNSRCAGLT